MLGIYTKSHLGTIPQCACSLNPRTSYLNHPTTTHPQWHDPKMPSDTNTSDGTNGLRSVHMLCVDTPSVIVWWSAITPGFHGAARVACQQGHGDVTQMVRQAAATAASAAVAAVTAAATTLACSLAYSASHVIRNRKVGMGDNIRARGTRHGNRRRMVHRTGWEARVESERCSLHSYYWQTENIHLHYGIHCRKQWYHKMDIVMLLCKKKECFFRTSLQILIDLG